MLVTYWVNYYNFVIYSWPMDNMSLNCMGLLFSLNTLYNTTWLAFGCIFRCGPTDMGDDCEVKCTVDCVKGWCRYLVFCWMSNYSLKSGSVVPPALFFFLKFALAIQGLLWFHTIFRIVLNLYKLFYFCENDIGISIEISLNQ